MRLDHLLSKEHVPSRLYTAEYGGQSYGSECLLMALMGGTLTLMQERLRSTRYAWFVRMWVGKVGVGETCICTLLGPEGPEHGYFGIGDLILLDFVVVGIHRRHDRVPPVL